MCNNRCSAAVFWAIALFCCLSPASLPLCWLCDVLARAVHSGFLLAQHNTAQHRTSQHSTVQCVLRAVLRRMPRALAGRNLILTGPPSCCFSFLVYCLVQHHKLLLQSYSTVVAVGHTLQCFSAPFVAQRASRPTPHFAPRVFCRASRKSQSSAFGRRGVAAFAAPRICSTVPAVLHVLAELQHVAFSEKIKHSTSPAQ